MTPYIRWPFRVLTGTKITGVDMRLLFKLSFGSLNGELMHCGNSPEEPMLIDMIFI